MTTHSNPVGDWVHVYDKERPFVGTVVADVEYDKRRIGLLVAIDSYKGEPSTPIGVARPIVFVSQQTARSSVHGDPEGGPAVDIKGGWLVRRTHAVPTTGDRG